MKIPCLPVYPIGFLCISVFAVVVLGGNAAAGGFQVVGWGDNTFGQAAVPAGLTNVVAVAAGARNSLALREDGTVTIWGDNSLGQTNLPPD